MGGAVAHRPFFGARARKRPFSRESWLRWQAPWPKMAPHGTRQPRKAAKSQPRPTLAPGSHCNAVPCVHVRVGALGRPRPLRGSVPPRRARRRQPLRRRERTAPPVAQALILMTARVRNKRGPVFVPAHWQFPVLAAALLQRLAFSVMNLVEYRHFVPQIVTHFVMSQNFIFVGIATNDSKLAKKNTIYWAIFGIC